jgi:hypothetical protein
MRELRVGGLISHRIRRWSECDTFRGIAGVAIGLVVVFVGAVRRPSSGVGRGQGK